MKKLFSLLKPYRVHIIVGFACKLVEAFFELIIPVLMSKIIDTGIKTNNAAYVLRICGLMFFLVCLGLIMAVICQKLAALTSQGFGTRLRSFLFSHIINLPFEEFDSFSKDSLIVRITGDTEKLQVAIALTIRIASRAPFLLIGSIICAAMIDGPLALILLFAAIILGVILPLLMAKALKLFSSFLKKLDKMTEVLEDNLFGFKTIRAFTRFNSEKQRFANINTSSGEIEKKAAVISFLSNPLTTFILNIALAAILWFGGIRVFEGNITRGEVIAFTGYMSQIMLAIVALANLMLIYTNAFAATLRIKEVINVNSFIKSGGILPSDTINIELKNVSFSYKELLENTLENISFKADFGQIIGITGKTGSGKSTLINLLQRFYDVKHGEILLSGRKIEEYDIDRLREKIGVVMQETDVFSGTLLSNIAGTGEAANEKRALAAADFAQLASFINENGILYKVSENGSNLSGGQRQRLAIARAVYKDPKILILDDALSSLDTVTAGRIIKEICKIKKNMLVFIISQKIKNLEFADKILVLENSGMAGFGSHKELLESSPVYREIYLSQTREDL